LAVATTTAWAGGAKAEIFDVTETGQFGPNESLGLAGGTQTPFANATSYSFTGQFDTNTTNFMAGSPFEPGFVAYAPTWLNLTVGGKTYSVEPYSASAPPPPFTGGNGSLSGPAGLTIAIYDYTTPFGNPGTTETPGNTPNKHHISIGLLQDPPADGAGIMQDWLGSSPTFTSNHLVSTTFVGAYGVGYGSGVCNKPGGDHCDTNPIPLTLNGTTYYLELGNEDVTYAGYNGAQDDPNDPRVQNAFAQTASLTAVPEPASMSLFGVALAMIGVARRKSAARA
jgi:hypothetical protein